MINVYLDDVRPCPAGFVAARTAEECLLLLREYEVNVLSLDYELGYGQPSGFAVVAGLIAAGTHPREVYVHSSSMMGRAQMVKGLRDAGIAGLIVHDGPMPPAVLEAAASSAAGSGKDEAP
ncbi:cyclic-phosphate processing receiver domain-containing protein [Cohnella rhizosphaerae]|uniref:Cell division protein FtsJ n=1 Tax=Cohnella rhizosphaerae TaxID=1457232 RepID=A0A9X4KY37_9BACL|nr:cyclic-phosphate processing receiver domain-containing protein [Cohnella rhizosphaerae]MDG0812987.1 cell division protein FtsJ [Cohnella rhizosphaerae]